jgi:hypothetical protein
LILMRSLPKSFLPILIVSVSLLSAAQIGNAEPTLKPPEAEQHKRLTNEQKPKAESNKASASATPSQINPQPSGLISGAAPQEEKHGSDHIRPEATVAELIMVGITAAYVIVAFFTLLAIKGQGDIAEKQARLAKSAIIATSHSERAWIGYEFEEMEGIEKIGNIRSKWNEFKSLDTSSLFIVVTAKGVLLNSGKTPAKILKGVLKLDCIDPLQLPEEPNYTTPAPDTAVFIIAPNRPSAFTAPLAMNYQSLADWFVGNRALVLYGFIRYQDVLPEPEEHESRFCMISQFPRVWPAPVGFRFGGPPAYNRYT